MSTIPPAAGATRYDLLLALDELESLREELLELGVPARADLVEHGTPAVADLLADLQALGLDSLAAVNARIAELHRRLDAVEDQTG